MTPLPLNQIGLSWRHHVSALWWLALLYRQPYHFREALRTLPLKHRVVTGFCLLGPALPWMLLVSLVVELLGIGIALASGLSSFTAILLVKHAVGTAMGTTLGIASGITVGIGVGIVGGIADGIAIGLAGEITFGIAGGIVGGIATGIANEIPGKITGGIASGTVLGIVLGIAGGIVIGIAGGIARGIATKIAVGIAVGITLGIALGMANWTANEIAFRITAGSTNEIAFQIAVGIAGGIAVGIAALRAYHLLPHLLFLWPKLRGPWYRYHPIAWDNLCSIPFPGLDRLLLAYADLAPTEADQEIERLIDSYPSQRFQALKAKAALIARTAGKEQNLARLDDIVAALPRGDQGFLVEVPRVCEKIGELAALQRHLDTITRPLFRAPHAALLKEKIDRFRDQIAGFPEPLGSEFRAAAAHWLAIAERQWREAQAVVDKEPSPQVFRAGDPADRRQEAFLLRQRVIGDLEAQLMLATGCPGLVLYGRRRTGKSTLLRNLDGFLPDTVTVAALSMQDPRAFTALDSFAGLIAGTIAGALPDAPRPPAPPATLPALFALLDATNRWLLGEDRRLLLAVDEYEFLDTKITEGVLPADLLAMVRESIQTHRRLIWLFAGSHHIAELTHPAWTSAFVSVRTLDMPLFDLSETRLLLTEPLRHSPLWAKDDPRRPRFAPEFWGEDGIERLHADAGGWPHLVQLLAETAVNLVNDSAAHGLDPALYQRTLDKAVESGDIVLRQLLERECRLDGEWPYLSAFRTGETQPPPSDPAIARALRRRLLVVEDGDRWRLRVPLMRHWLRERG